LSNLQKAPRFEEPFFFRIEDQESGLCAATSERFTISTHRLRRKKSAASLQFVRKITGFNKPSKANGAAFHAAIEEIAAASTRLLHSLETSAPPKNREEEAAKAKARGAQRFSA